MGPEKAGDAEGQVLFSSALAQTFALSADDQGEGTAQARFNSQKKFLRKLQSAQAQAFRTGNGAPRMPSKASRRAEVQAPLDDVYPLRRCIPEVRGWF